MDAFEIILYVAVMIIWVIVQNARKKKLQQQKQAQASQEVEEENENPQSRSIMDEILREIREEKNQDEYEEAPIRTYERSQSDIEAEEKNAEYNRRLEAINSKKKSKALSKRFDSYKIETSRQEEEESEENEYANLIFENPDSTRNAIILSEILNRKHF